MAIVQIKMAIVPERERFNKITDPEREQLQLNLFPDPKIQTEISLKKHIASGVMIPETYITETLSHHFVDSKKDIISGSSFRNKTVIKSTWSETKAKTFKSIKIYKKVTKSYEKL